MIRASGTVVTCSVATPPERTHAGETDAVTGTFADDPPREDPALGPTTNIPGDGVCDGLDCAPEVSGWLPGRAAGPCAPAPWAPVPGVVVALACARRWRVRGAPPDEHPAA